MIFTRGNLFDARVDAIVNAVNTVGVMGKGLALTFKQRYPANFAAYAAACRAGEVQVGRMFIHDRGAGEAPRWIVNFPTKKHWRDPSRIEWIEAGLLDLENAIRETGIGSIALPALGCGNGGLVWSEVRPRIEATFAGMPGVKAIVYEPGELAADLRA